jgi:predicted small lipoprotein YifL
MRLRLPTAVTCMIVILCLGGLSACGKKSALTPPPESEYPKQYPRQ